MNTMIGKEKPLEKMGVYRQGEEKEYGNSQCKLQEMKDTAPKGTGISQKEVAFDVDAVSLYDRLPELTFASDSSSNSDTSRRVLTETHFRRLAPSENGDSTASLSSLGGPPMTPSESNADDNEVANLSPIASIEEEASDSLASKNSPVSWGTVTIRNYPIIPGDHPDTYEGPPLTIDWRHVSESTKTVDEYEAMRGPRKREEDLRLGWVTRRQMLRRVGVSDDELREAQNISRKSREQREATIARLKFQKVEEIKQRFVRGLGRAFHPKKTLQTRY